MRSPIGQHTAPFACWSVSFFWTPSPTSRSRRKKLTSCFVGNKCSWYLCLQRFSRFCCGACPENTLRVFMPCISDTVWELLVSTFTDRQAMRRHMCGATLLYLEFRIAFVFLIVHWCRCRYRTDRHRTSQRRLRQQGCDFANILRSGAPNLHLSAKATYSFETRSLVLVRGRSPFARFVLTWNTCGLDHAL